MLYLTSNEMRMRPQTRNKGGRENMSRQQLDPKTKTMSTFKAKLKVFLKSKAKAKSKSEPKSTLKSKGKPKLMNLKNIEMAKSRQLSKILGTNGMTG